MASALRLYKYRLGVVRKEALQAAPAEFVELLEPAKPVHCQGGSGYSQTPVMHSGISIEINGAIIRFDSSVSEAMISSTVMAVRNA